MIHFKTLANIDLKKYDSCIQKDPRSLPYAHSWYLNTVCNQWDCLVLDDYQLVWPLVFNKKKGFKQYYRPFATQQLGIYGPQKVTDEILSAFINEMVGKVRYADLYLNEGQYLNSGSKQQWSFEEQTNIVLDTGGSYEDIYAKFSTNLKRKIKKTNQQDFQLFEHDGPDVVLDIFKNGRGQDLKLPEEYYMNFKQLMYKLLHKGLGKVYSVYGGPNQVLAAAFFLEYRDRSIFLFSGTIPLGKELNAMAYLINEYLIFNSDRFEVFDFEGSNDPGLAQFYKSFGGISRSYHRLFLNRLPWPLSTL